MINSDLERAEFVYLHENQVFIVPAGELIIFVYDFRYVYGIGNLLIPCTDAFLVINILQYKCTYMYVCACAHVCAWVCECLCAYEYVYVFLYKYIYILAYI